MADEYEFTDRDFNSMLHPEGAPGSMNAIFGDKGTTAVIRQTVASSQYYEALAFRSQTFGVATLTATLLGLVAAVPALLLLWKVALG